MGLSEKLNTTNKSLAEILAELEKKECVFLSIQPSGSCNLWPVVLETFGRKAAS